MMFLWVILHDILPTHLLDRMPKERDRPSLLADRLNLAFILQPSSLSPHHSPRHRIIRKLVKPLAKG